ncbi:MAG: hypothetical protein NVV73_16400 [Cellvibrionaceae bacterium]|nr:hypothetical protein [Cellvibrionaceae bacterium]
MSLEILLKVFYGWAILLTICMVCVAATFFIHILVPKSLLKTYFKPPHFSAGEVAIFSAFPFMFMRTVMFMRIVGFPNSGKKRGLTQAYQLAPSWFRLVSKVVVGVFILASAPMFALIPYLYFGYCVVHGPC